MSKRNSHLNGYFFFFFFLLISSHFPSFKIDNFLSYLNSSKKSYLQICLNEDITPSVAIINMLRESELGKVTCLSLLINTFNSLNRPTCFSWDESQQLWTHWSQYHSSSQNITGNLHIPIPIYLIPIQAQQAYPFHRLDCQLIDSNNSLNHHHHHV